MQKEDDAIILASCKTLQILEKRSTRFRMDARMQLARFESDLQHGIPFHLFVEGMTFPLSEPSPAHLVNVSRFVCYK